MTNASVRGFARPLNAASSPRFPSRPLTRLYSSRYFLVPCDFIRCVNYHNKITYFFLSDTILTGNTYGKKSEKEARHVSAFYGISFKFGLGLSKITSDANGFSAMNIVISSLERKKDSYFA